MTLRYTLEEREAMALVRKAKARAREPAERTKIVLPPRPKLTDKQRAAIHARHDGQCYVCGTNLPVQGPTVQYDHILERALKGSDAADNLAPICTVPCHAEKTSRFLTTLAHVDRAGAKHRGEIKPKGTIKSAGFPNRKQKFRHAFSNRQHTGQDQ